MVRNSKKSPKKRYRLAVATAALVIILIAGGIYFIHRSHAKDVQDAKTAAQTASVKSAASTSTYSTTPLDSTANNSSNESRKSGTTSNTTLSTPASNPDLAVTITRVSGAEVYTQVNGASSGTCNLTATQSGYPDITASSQVEQNVNSFDCQSFNLPSSDFSTGHWSIVVSVTSGNSTVNSIPWVTQ
jgi:hypothetical protein